MKGRPSSLGRSTGTGAAEVGGACCAKAADGPSTASPRKSTARRIIQSAPETCGAGPRRPAWQGMGCHPAGTGWRSPWQAVEILAQAGRSTGDKNRLLIAGKRRLSDQVVFHRPAADEMFLDDPLEDRRIALAIPRAVRVDDGDGTRLADAKAVGLCAQHAVVGEPQLDQTSLQIVPRHNRPIPIAAFRLGLVAAEENVAPGDAEPQLLDDGVFR